MICKYFHAKEIFSQLQLSQFFQAYYFLMFKLLKVIFLIFWEEVLRKNV